MYPAISPPTPPIYTFPTLSHSDTGEPLMAMQNSNPNLTSKKRTRPSSSPGPLNGVFTRRKTQIYLHCNRSGRTRSDSFLYEKLQLNPPESISKRPRGSDLTLDSAADTDDDLSRILIRDLRLRRVFSPGSSIAKECEMAAVNKKMKNSAEGREGSEGGFACVVMSDIFCVKDDVKVTENGEFEEPMNKSVHENVENLSGNVAVSEGSAFINNGDEGFSNEFGGLKEEECLQATPPDSEMLGCRIVDNEVEMASKNSEWKANSNTEKIGGVFQGNVEKKNGNSLETKFILSPCSRARVFKAPGSFSYRRLLPFLVDMARESSCVERKINLDNEQMRMDKSQADGSVAKNNNEVSAHLSQKPAIEEKQRIEVEESKKYHNLQNSSPECPSQRENLNSDSSNQAKPTDIKETETPNAELSCNDGLSLNSERDLQNRDEEACKHADEARPIDCQQAKEFETGDPYISLSDKTEKKDDNDGGDQGKSADSNEEPIQVVQADAEIYDRAKENSNTSIECAIQSSNQLPQKPVYRSISSNNGSEHVKPVASNSKSKLGLSPCAKLKRLKTPSSFSYKRLLPYLMEISKDCSGESGNTHSQDSREVNQPSTVSSEVCKFSAEEQNTNNSQEMQISTVTATSHSSNSNRVNLMSAQQVTGASMSFGSQEQESKSNNAVAEKEKQLDGASEIETSIHESNTSTMLLNAYVIPPKSSSCGSIDFVQQRLSAVGGSTKAVEVCGISQRSLQLDDSDSLRIAHCSRKSILKRNPRGCRGLCSCLNCASFRLHAERAFEFSKNQMQDAEEITLDLVRELSHLRNLLEKSAFSSDANVGVTCSNQVKEACKKASEAQELAKGRISQMIYDLNVHCRIPCSQPPRVTFAIDERVISNQSLKQKQ